MGQKLPDDEIELYRRIDEVIHYIWDPLGVAGNSYARNEYYAYLPKLFQLAKEEDAEEKLSAHLNWIQTEDIGTRSNPQRCREIAKIIVAWVETLNEGSSGA